MNKNENKSLLRLLSYILVAALASGVTWFLADLQPSSKLEQMSRLIEDRFIGQKDVKEYEDAAAAAMVSALGDRWSSYIPADAYRDHVDNQNNSFVGIGVTILKLADGSGFQIQEVVADGPADKAGICLGDILTHVEGQNVTDLETSDLRSRILGEKNTQVEITVLRGDRQLTFPVTRDTVHQEAAKGQLLQGNVGLVTISNFHAGAGKEIIDQVKALTEQGAQGLIFDVRNNPGGFVDELVEALDYLLPEGPLFCSVDYRGTEKVEQSDAACLELPMAVIVNGSSYSAAEFFAAALSEYDWAVTVGEPTVGKGYFQYTIKLMDGSALYLSTGKYFTPQGVSLAEVGGLTPDIAVEPSQGAVLPEEDPQIQAALEALAVQNK